MSDCEFVVNVTLIRSKGGLLNMLDRRVTIVDDTVRVVGGSKELIFKIQCFAWKKLKIPEYNGRVAVVGIDFDSKNTGNLPNVSLKLVVKPDNQPMLSNFIKTFNKFIEENENSSSPSTLLWKVQESSSSKDSKTSPVQMRSIQKSQIDGKESLEILARNVNSHILNFVMIISDLQDEVAKNFMEEDGLEGVIAKSSLAKMVHIMSKYAASGNSQQLRKFPTVVQKHFTMWLSLRKVAQQFDTRQKQKYASIPAKLSFYYMFNGELCKGIVCLLDYVEMMPDDHLAMEAALQWLLFLGETELAEKKIKIWKMNKNSEEFFTVAELVIMYTNFKEKRKEAVTKLVALRDKVKEENNLSFQKYNLASFVYWICSTLSNSPASSVLEECDTPDRLSQLLEASRKADSIIKNTIPSLSTSKLDNSVSPSIRTYLEEKHTGSAARYINLGSSIAWHFEMRRELSLVTTATAQGRDSESAMILNLRSALKSASLFRIMQSTNLMSYYTMITEEEDSENDIKIMKASLLNLISPDPIIMNCSIPDKSKTPLGAQTLLLGQKASVREDEPREAIIEEVADRLAHLEIINKKKFHSIKSNCGCNVCMQYPFSSTFAAEYMFAYCILHNFSQPSIQSFNTEFVGIRERDIPFQRTMHKDKAIRPRPNAIQNEVFGLCIVQWLIRKIDRKEPADEKSLEVYKNACKITEYMKQRTMDLALAIKHLGRQLEFPQTCNYSWMRPVMRKPPREAKIESASDMLRAVSPFGHRVKTTLPQNEVTVTSEKVEAMRLGMKHEMNRYCHILYRDWRCRLYPYVGRTSENAWEAAYAWAESTSIGARNAVQSKIEKCRKGLVTISGPERFRECVEAMPDDMTLVQLAMADNKDIYMIKLHADRDPIIMPVAHNSKAMELMGKFTFLLKEDEKKTKPRGTKELEEYWKKRKIIDGRMKTFVAEVQKNFFGVSASLLMPTDRLGPAAQEVALEMHRMSEQGLRLGEAQEMVYLSKHVNVESWEQLGLRFCEMRNRDPDFRDKLLKLHRRCREAMRQDWATGETKSSKKYTYLVVCPQLSQFCWERLPIFDNFPYVARQVSIHSTFSQLEAMRNQEKEIPLQVDVQNAYYVLDPQNNLEGMKTRMLNYIEKFNWEGTVGETPDVKDISRALANAETFFYFGHGSGSAVIPRSVIRQVTCNAIVTLMGCSSVRIIPQAHGFDGKSSLFDYAIAKCPLIVGCLWTVTDREIDKFLMRMVDDCFEKAKEVTGIDKLRLLSEAMADARSTVRLPYLTGAAVVMYGLPVISKESNVAKGSNPTSSENLNMLNDNLGSLNAFVTPRKKTNKPKTSLRQLDLELENENQSSSVSLSTTAVESLNTPKHAETIPKIPKTRKKPTVASGETPVPMIPRAPPKSVSCAVEEVEPKSTRVLRTRSSIRTPSRSRRN